jgi:hypothetical protein
VIGKGNYLQAVKQGHTNYISGCHIIVSAGGEAGVDMKIAPIGTHRFLSSAALPILTHISYAESGVESTVIPFSDAFCISASPSSTPSARIIAAAVETLKEALNGKQIQPVLI